MCDAELLRSLQSIASNQITWWVCAALWFARLGWAVAGRNTSRRRHITTALLTAATLFAVFLIARETDRLTHRPYQSDEEIVVPARPYHSTVGEWNTQEA